MILQGLSNCKRGFLSEILLQLFKLVCPRPSRSRVERKSRERHSAGFRHERRRKGDGAAPLFPLLIPPRFFFSSSPRFSTTSLKRTTQNRLILKSFCSSNWRRSPLSLPRTLLVENIHEVQSLRAWKNIRNNVYEKNYALLIGWKWVPCHVTRVQSWQGLNVIWPDVVGVISNLKEQSENLSVSQFSAIF